MAGGWSVAAVAVGSLVVCSCSIGELDIEGKQCPCPEPDWSCNTLSNQCCAPRFDVEGFSADWVTSRNVRWQWTPLGAEDDFGSYVIDVARTPAEIESGAPQHRIDQESNPELGRYILLNTHDPEVTDASVTYDLDNPVGWYGRMTARDATGCPFHSAIAPATTLPDPLQRVVLFDDQPPATLLFSHGSFDLADCDGDPCLESVSGSSETQNLRLFDLAIGGSAFDMSVVQFEAQAMLEMRVWLEDSTSSFWTSIWLELPPPAGIFRFEPYSPIRTPTEPAQSSYLTVQVPLRELLRDADGLPLTHQQLTDPSAGGVVQVSFGTIVPESKRVWLDDISIRW
jgi:hypothetical protein